MNTLKDGAVAIATGDPIFCEACKAVLNIHSTVENESSWKCEFCLHTNEIDVDPEEIPTSDAVNYVMEAPAVVGDKMTSNGEGGDISVVFCIDISGSMCVSEAVSGKFNIKGDKVKDNMNDLAKFGDGSEQRLDGENRNITYVSRLQCV
jgi:hypothetical protein